MMKYIAKANLDAFFEAADAHLHLYIPTNDKNGKAEYTRWTKGAEAEGRPLPRDMQLGRSRDLNPGSVTITSASLSPPCWPIWSASPV